MNGWGSINIYLLIMDVVLAAAVIYLLVSQKRRLRGALSEAEAGEGLLKDPVTQLYNRRHLIQRLQESMSRCERDKKNMAVVLWDIDGFSGFNNEFGKKEGDRLLQQVAACIKKTMRVYDDVFRSGPDEFSSVLIPADQDVVQEVTKRVGDLVAKELFEGESEYARRKFTLSSGAAFYPEESQSVDSLLYAARQALFKTRMSTSSLN